MFNYIPRSKRAATILTQNSKINATATSPTFTTNLPQPHDVVTTVPSSHGELCIGQNNHLRIPVGEGIRRHVLHASVSCCLDQENHL